MQYSVRVNKWFNKIASVTGTYVRPVLATWYSCSGMMREKAELMAHSCLLSSYARGGISIASLKSVNEEAETK